MADEPRLVESEDEDIRLPNTRHGWMISLALMAGASLILVALARPPEHRLVAAAFILFASFLGPFVAGAMDKLSLDRSVPFGAALGVIALIYFNVVAGQAAGGSFYEPGSRKFGALLYLLAFAGPPTASILGAVSGCWIANARRPRDESDDELGV